MDIKRVVKYSFISMALIIFIITAINTIVIYQIKENNSTKQSINDLVSMQEKMNEIFARVEDIMTETTQNFSEEKTDEKLQNAAVKNKFSSLDALAIHLANNYNGVATSDLHQSKIAQELSISDASVSRGIKKLQKQERLNGHVDSVVLMK